MNYWKMLLTGTYTGSQVEAEKFLEFCEKHNLTSEDIHELNIAVLELTAMIQKWALPPYKFFEGQFKFKKMEGN